MKVRLPKHIPAEKKKELGQIKKIVVAHAPLEFLILYGSYARGDFVEFDDTPEFERAGHYASDFDLLAVVREGNVEKDFELWHTIDDKLKSKIGTRFRLEVEQIGDLNKRLKQGRSFFLDLYREGIILFDSGQSKLVNPVNPLDLSPRQRKKQAKEDFKNYFKKANTFIKHADYALKDADYEVSVFFLHQTVESLYNALALVLTGYSPRFHNLDLLENWLLQVLDESQSLSVLVKQIQKQSNLRSSAILPNKDRYVPVRESAKKLASIFPKEPPAEKELFKLLVRAYIEARYNNKYKVKLEEAEELGKRGKILHDLAEELCLKKIGEL